jgi:hypothetical protein
MSKTERQIATFLALAISALLLTNPCFGYDDLGSSARARGMGNSFVAVADDPSAVFYNPAGLAALKTWHLSLLYDRKSRYGVPEGENPFLASGVMALPVSENLCIAVSGCQSGSWSDPTQVVTNNMGQLSLSTQLNDGVSIGLSGKFLYNSNFGEKKGADLDLGILYHPAQNLSVGIVGENLLATDMQSEVPPTSSLSGRSSRKGKIGLCYVYDDKDFLTRIAFDLVVKDARQPVKKTYAQESFGIEHWIFDQKRTSLALRGGYTLGKDYELDYEQPSFGCGLRYRGKEIFVQIDYSWQKYPHQIEERFAGDHRLSITLGPSSAREVAEFVGPGPKSDLGQRQMVQQPRKPISGHASGVASNVKALEFDLKSRVEDVSLGGDESVVFLLRPQVDFEASEWRLYICGLEPFGWDEYQIEPCLLRMIRGQGMPGFGVLWDLRLNNGDMKIGKYFYALVLVDRDDQRWHSTWRSFRVK